MFPKKCEKLRLEIALQMMLFLSRDVRECGSHLPPPKGKRPIPLLPFKPRNTGAFTHPVRRGALDIAHRRRNRQYRREGQEKMNVVVHPAPSECLHAMLARDAAHVSPQRRLNLWDNSLLPLLGGEGTMEERTAIGV